jgi:RNA polymerase sigma-70 factor, ECF subfamily
MAYAIIRAVSVFPPKQLTTTRMLYSFEDHRIEAPAIASTEPTDEQLMARIKTGDETALSMLHRRHSGLLHTVGHRVINNESDVDDLVQEVFLQVWRQAEHYREENGKALGWIVTLTRRRAIDKLRKKQAYQRAAERLRLETTGSDSTSPERGADHEAADSDRAQIFTRVLASLPEGQRQALDLAFYRGMSQREIASRTGLPLGTIKTRLELALRKVRSAILALGGAEEWSLTQA